MGKDESEDEVWEEQTGNDDYDCDTDEEIENLKNEEKDSRKRLEIDDSSCNRNDTSHAYDCDTDEEENEAESEINDPYDAETDIDEDELERLLPNTENISVEKLTNFFQDHHFFLHKELSTKEMKLLNRYVIACGGVVKSYMDNKVEFIIAKNVSEEEIEDARKVRKDVKIVKPKWIFRCKDKDSLVDVDSYLI